MPDWLMILLLVLVAPVLGILLVDSLLRAWLMLVSWPAVPEPGLPATGARALAVVIPAHNEGAIIGATVARLQAQMPPAGLFVMADNCTDQTAAAARRAGARVWERHDRGGEQGKGTALRWFLAVAAQELQAYDAIAIFDADSIVDAGFLDHTGAALACGADVVQGFVRSLSGGSPAATLAAYSEILSQRLDDAARNRLGWPVPLRGTGMAFRREVLEALLPHLQTKVEDVEMSLLLAAQGRHVSFVPAAVVGDPKPTGVRGAAAQRARWLQGQAEVWRHYWRAILCLVLTGGPAAWSLLAALLLKPKTLLLALKVVLFLILWLVSFAPAWLHTLLWGTVGLVIALDVAYYIVGLLFVEDWRRYARVMVLSPLYLAMWLWSMGLMLISKETWLRARD